MALTLPAVPTAGPTRADVIAALNPADPSVDIDDPAPRLIAGMADFDQALLLVVAAIRSGLLQLESVVGAVGSGNLDAINTQLSSLQSQVSDKASVASVTTLAQSVAQVVSGLGDYARVGQIPTTPGEVGADPAGSSAAVRALLTGGTYATATNLSDGLAGKINVSTFNAKMTSLDATDAAAVTAIAAKYAKPSTGIPETDLAQAVRDKLTAAPSGAGQYITTDPDDADNLVISTASGSPFQLDPNDSDVLVVTL